MKCERFSVDQIVAAVMQHNLGVSATEIGRKLGLAEQTIYFGKSSTMAWRLPRSGRSSD